MILVETQPGIFVPGSRILRLVDAGGGKTRIEADGGNYHVNNTPLMVAKLLSWFSSPTVITWEQLNEREGVRETRA